MDEEHIAGGREESEPQRTDEPERQDASADDAPKSAASAAADEERSATEEPRATQPAEPGESSAEPEGAAEPRSAATEEPGGEPAEPAAAQAKHKNPQRSFAYRAPTIEPTHYVRSPVPQPPEHRPAEPARPPRPAPQPTNPQKGRKRLADALWPPRFSRNQVVVGVLLAILGAGIVIQVHSNENTDQILRGARPEDLVNILDDVTARSQRLDTELRDLQNDKTQLQTSSDRAKAALDQAQAKAGSLAILAGTVKAVGPGITLNISDPDHRVTAAALLNTLEELRAAGAEVVQVNNVRVVASTWFSDGAQGHVTVDGQDLSGPYIFKAIGDPASLQPALSIPGGVLPTLKSEYDASGAVTSGTVTIDAVRSLTSPQYASPH